MKRTLYIFFFVQCLAVCCCAQTAQQVVDKLFAKLSSETLECEFSATVTTDNNNRPATALKGTLQMRDKVFHASVFDTELSYDGSTLATYDAETNELTLSYPTPEELQEGNPLLYAKAMAEGCTATFAPEQPQGRYFLLLLPKIAGSEIVNISITADKSSLLPETIVVRGTKDTTTIRLSGQRWTSEAPTTTIPTHNENTEPPFINDLR